MGCPRQQCQFRDKVVVIAGAGSGIGRALARQLAVRGARLALSDINRSALDETVRSLAQCDVRAYVFDASSRKAFFDHADQGHMAKAMFWIARLFPDAYPALMRRLTA
ncbi:MAG: SDR family NAD(P)-dependent oxidoreductase [Gammaproteobacteria bacterium]|nr:SDR family NAD(P)-dependent oxidoreductase [Gammaproteobacteria bacterium]